MFPVKVVIAIIITTLNKLKQLYLNVMNLLFSVVMEKESLITINFYIFYTIFPLKGACFLLRTDFNSLEVSLAVLGFKMFKAHG
jgi:hypothetical protein